MTWRKLFTPVISQALDDLPRGWPAAELRLAMREAYPGGREWPYRVWRDEANEQIRRRVQAPSVKDCPGQVLMVHAK